MKLKRRLLSGGLALAMVAGSFFINSGKVNAEDPVPWVPSPADEAFAAAAPADWAFDVTSVPLHNAILVKYPTIDNAPLDGYISKSEANSKSGYMSVSGASITGTAAGMENFTELQYLDIHGTKLCDTLDSFMELDQLISLELYNNTLMTGGIPTSILNLSKLQNLTLTGTPLGGEIPNELGLLPDLSKISINSTSLTGEIPSSIGNLLKLEYFAIANNNIQGTLPSGFATLELLRTVDITNTKVSGKIPSSFNNLTTFYYSNSSLEILALGQSDSKLVDLLDQDMIDSLEVEVNNMPLASIPNYSLRLSSIQDLLDLRTDAETEVTGLFTTAGDNLAVGITETEIVAAEALVTALPSPSDTVTNLQAKIDLARQMLEAKIATDALLTIALDNTNLANGITQADITAAQDLVTALDDTSAGALKTELQAKIDTAQDLLDGTKLVSDLFTDGTKTALATSVTQGVINAAKTAVEALPVGNTQDALLADIATAQGLLDAKTLADSKTAAKADLDQKATDAKTAIDDLPNLTSDEKTAAKEAVDNALTDAKDAVDLATTPADVVTEKDSGVTKINDEVTKAEVLDTLNAAKTAAKAELDQKATDAKNAINALPNLTDGEKTAAKEAVDNALTDAKDAVDIATTPADVGTEKDLGVTKINDEVTKASALDVLNAAKAAAKADLDQKAIDAKNVINALPNLTDSEKVTEINKVDTDLSNAKIAIDSATDTPAVTSAKTAGETDINQDVAHAQALDLENAKTAAKAELVAKAEAVKNAIDGLTNLSTAEKATAKGAVEAELTRGSNAIDAATTVAKVTEEKTTSLANMDKILKDAKALDAKNAVANLFDDKGKIKEDVNQDVINNAKAKVEGLDPGAEKDLLNVLIVEAQKQLDAKNAVEPTPVKPIYSGAPAKTFDNISTGDHSNSIFYVMGMLLALLGLGFIVRRKMMKQS